MVSDTGTGIPNGVLATMKEEIHNIDTSSTRNTSGGIGLGLHIAKLCATKLNATLTLSSRRPAATPSQKAAKEKSQGWTTAFSFITTFEVVPHTEQQPEEKAESPTSSPTPSPATTPRPGADSELGVFHCLSDPQQQISIVEQLTSPEFTAARAAFRILIVEDNAINIKVLQRIFARNGFTNNVVSLNGQQAVDECSKRMQEATESSSSVKLIPSGTPVPTRSTPFDLILMDCEMPVKDGWNATLELRELGCLSPIFALTSNATQQGQVRCRESGMDLFLNKPLSAQGLLFAIAALPPFLLYPLEYCPHVLLPTAFTLPPIQELV
jgi:CheY-like chemotaxis protein